MFTDPPSGGDLHVQFVLPSGVSWDQLTKQQRAEIYIYGPAQILQRPDQTNPGFSEHISNYVELLTRPTYPPFIDEGPSQ